MSSPPPTRRAAAGPRDAAAGRRCLLSLGTCLSLAAGCTAPPRAVSPPPPALEAYVRVHGPGWPAAALEREAVMQLEEAARAAPGVLAVVSRSEDGWGELRLRLRDAEALGSLRGAIDAVQPRLPRDLDVPTIGRSVAPEPLFAVRLRGPAQLERAAIAALERTPGVARVEVCGGAEPALIIAVDRARVAALGVTIDGLLAALRPAVGTETLFPARIGAPPPAAVDPATLGELAVPGAAQVRLSDVATVSRTLLPRGCRAFDADGEVVLLTVLGRAGAVAAEVAAAAGPAIAGLSRPPDAGVALVPAAGERGPALLELEMRQATDPAELVAGLRPCLANVPGLRGWAVAIEDSPVPFADAGPPPNPAFWPPRARARLLLAVVGDGEPAGSGEGTPGQAADGFSLAALRAPLRLCGAVQNAAALAPAAQADRRVGVQIAGADLEELARLLEAAHGRASVLHGVTLLRAHVARRRTTRTLMLDRERLSAAGVVASAAAGVVALAQGPLELGTRSDGERVQVTLAGDGSGLEGLQVAGKDGPVAVAGLVQVREEEVWTPRLRAELGPVAALELRLLDAKTRTAVLATLAELELPAGVTLAVVDDPLLP